MTTKTVNMMTKYIYNTSSSLKIPSDCDEQIKSTNILINTQKINVYATMIIIIVGLFGNSLAVFVFIQKRFRIHSSSIYLLCLAISDGLFLLMHFFEDTLRTYIDIYLNGDHSNVDPLCFTIANSIRSFRHSSAMVNKDSLLRLINITDRFDFSCSLVNYFRYFLRFLSAYIIVVFTIQRAIAIHFPFHFQAKFESNLIAWLIIIFVTLIGGISNMWVPFLFKPRELFLDKTYSIKYCDIQKDYKSSYFVITISYIVITMLIPIVIIFLCNFLIIFFLIKAKEQRQSMLNGNLMNRKKILKNSFNKNEEICLLNSNQVLKSNNSNLNNSAETNFNMNSTPIINHNLTTSIIITKSNSNNNTTDTGTTSTPTTTYNNNNNILNMNSNSIKKNSIGNDSNKITKMLILMSFSYAILNLPYFISWCLFFYNIAFGKIGLIGSNYLFSALNICEIFYIMNYGIHFFIYCASGKKFRSQLKDTFQLLRS
jgi:hypothetical protein